MPAVMPQQSYGNSGTEEPSSSNLSALLRINSYLHNTLDLRNLAALAGHSQTSTSSNSIDSLWSDLVSGGDGGQRGTLPTRTKSLSVGGCSSAPAATTTSSSGGGLDLSSLQLSQLLNGAAAAAAAASSTNYPSSGYTNGVSDHCTQQLSCSSAGPLTGAGGSVFNYHHQQQAQTGYKDDNSLTLGSSGGSNSSSGGHSPPSAGGCSSLPSPTHFPYSSPPAANRLSRLSNVSDPGSPSLDDAIMMGIQSQRQQQQLQQQIQLQQQQQQLQQQQLQQQESVEKMTDITLADLVGSLNLSSNTACSSTGGSRGLSSGVGVSLCAPPSSSHGGGSVSPYANTLNGSLNSSNNMSLPHCMDLNQIAQLQSSLGSTGSANNSWGRGSGRADQSLSYSNLSSYSNGASAAPASFHNGLGGNQSYCSGRSNGSVLSGGGGSLSQSGPLDMLASLERGPLASLLSAQDPYSIEKAAKMHRTAAAVCEATCTWSGQLPVRIHKNPFYSCKVFLGGVPWDVTETALRQTFLHFGNIQVEWPGKENSANPPKGYVYILFDNEKQVKNLLAACSQDFSNGGNYYYKISSRRMRQKEVQVIPWVMSDSNYVRCPSYQLDPHKTVFVGALHGMLSAEALANIINDLFGGVVYAGIDTDKHKYPIGSGRITFNNLQSYRKAVRAAFVEIKTPKFTKKVQIDPYLADSLCQMCGMQQGPYFCRDETCFKYFCRTCWLVTPHHQSASSGCHKPLMRNSKLRTQTRLSGLV